MTQDTTALRVVHALEAEGLLAPEAEDRSRLVVEHALTARESEGASATPKLVEVVAYLGTALVLAAGFLFVLRSWDDLGDAGQVGFLAAVTLVLAIGGAVAASVAVDAGTADVRRRLGGTLLTGAAVAAGFTVGVAIDVFSDATFTGVSWPLVAGGLVACAGAAVGYRFSPTALGLAGMVLGLLVAGTEVGSSLASGPRNESLGVGGTSFAVAVVWVLLTERGLFQQVRSARILGVVAALFGAQAAAADAHRWVGYLLFVVVVVAGIWLYLTRRDWPHLAAAVIAVTLVVPEAVSDWSEGSLGVVGGVLVAGVTLLIASYAGYRLRQRREPPA